MWEQNSIQIFAESSDRSVGGEAKYKKSRAEGSGRWLNKKLKIVNEQMVFKVVRWELIIKGINADRKKKLIQGQSAEVLNISRKLFNTVHYILCNLSSRSQESLGSMLILLTIMSTIAHTMSPEKLKTQEYIQLLHPTHS